MEITTFIVSSVIGVLVLTVLFMWAIIADLQERIKKYKEQLAAPDDARTIKVFSKKWLGNYVAYMREYPKHHMVFEVKYSPSKGTYWINVESYGAQYDGYKGLKEYQDALAFVEQKIKGYQDSYVPLNYQIRTS